MSVTITITGNKSELETNFHPSLNVGDKYECGLLYFSAFNSIPNINLKNNIFSYGDNDKQLKLPCGTYDLHDISDYLENNLNDCEIKIKPNSNTLKCSLFCTKTVNFDTESTIGSLLGFPKTKLVANKWHESTNPVNILPVSVIRIECDLVLGSYVNGLPSHIIYEFVPNISPGHRYIEVPKNIIYFPINRRNISSVTIKIVDENGEHIDFRGENIQLRLHLRRSR